MGKMKTTNNVHGSFVMTREEIPIEFICDRCLQPKTAKVIVFWTSANGTSKRICNGCYGRLLSEKPL
jgi:hypothetical protein